MKEIKVGDYIRTTKGRIFKNDDDDVYYDENYREYVFNEDFILHENQIKKITSNIIDLIEVGDIVKILLNERTGETSIFCFESQKQVDILDEGNCKIIKSIVTKEQFAKMEYRLED